MFCFKCGKRLPASVVNCPDCDTPQKRRQRYRRRMILGLFIFLAGAIAGSLFDTVFFKGKAWNHSFLGFFAATPPEAPEGQLGNAPVLPVVTIKTTVASDPALINELASPALPEPLPLMEEAAPVPGMVSQPVIFNETASGSIHEVAALVASPPLNSPGAVDIDVDLPSGEVPVEKNFPEGRLGFSACEPLEKGDSSNYHGFMARDGSELLFASNRLKVNGKALYQCFTKKPEKQALATRVFEWAGNVWTPEATPDSAKIVFSSDSAQPEHIFVFDRATKNAKALTSGNSKNMMPAISPDGKLVAFVSNRRGSNHVWLIGIDGSNLLQITSGSEDDREPRWSADGRTLLFTRIHQPLKKSFIMKIQLDPMGEAQPIVDTSKRNWLADLSPDNSMLAYIRSESDDGSKNTLVVREMATGVEKILKPLGNAEYFRPVWNADCAGFVFHATLDGSRSLYQARFVREKAD